MSVQIIKRAEGERSDIQTFQAMRGDNPQIAYNSEGRITIRIPTTDGADVLVVLDRPTSRSLIHFIKSGIMELPSTTAWCAKCATEFNESLPFN